jgi:hypothetical protein
MGGYDHFYQRLITNFDLERVTGMFSMEAIIQDRAPDLMRLAPEPPNRKKPSARLPPVIPQRGAAKSPKSTSHK